MGVERMNSKLFWVEKKFKPHLERKEILDVVVFDSAFREKESSSEIEVIVIAKENIKISLPGFRITLLISEDFLKQNPLVHKLFKEGYSLKNEKYFSELYRFSNKILFKYDLVSLSPSIKVKVVNVLRGKNREKGMVEENSGEWLSNQVFFVPVEIGSLFEMFFLNMKVKFSKFFVLIDSQKNGKKQ
jgi:hypothetical protein